LNDYEAHFRDLDPAIGQWTKIDPQIEDGDVSISPYASMSNNPIFKIDPLGNEDGACCGGFWQGVKDLAVGLYNTAVYDARIINTYANPATPFVEAAAGKSVESDFSQDKSRVVSSGEAAITLIPLGKIAGVVAKVTEKVLEKTSEQAVEKTIEKTVEKLPDNANVVRGGLNTPESIVKGTGIHPEGVNGVSVECGTCSVKDLAKSLPHNQIETTTVGDVRKAGGDVIKTAGKSENHATLTGLSPQKNSELLNPTFQNANKQ